MRIAESLRHPYGTAQAIAYLAFIRYQRGDHAEGLALSERGLALGEEAALGVLRPFLDGLLGHGRIRAGDRGGLDVLRRAIDAQTATGFRYGLSLLTSWLCEGLLAEGRLDEAEAEVRRGMALAVDCNERRMQATFHQLLGDIAARRDPSSPGPAEASYRQGLAIAAELGAGPAVAHCRRSLGVLHQRTGRRAEAEEHLTAATAMFVAMDMPYWAAQPH